MVALSRILAVSALLTAAAAALPAAGSSVPPLVQDDRVHPAWELFTFKGIRPTLYSAATSGPTPSLRAVADGAAALLFTRVDIDPRSRPIVRWRWRVDGPVAGGDLTHRTADDAAARVFVAFRYHPRLVGPWQQLRYDLARLRYGEHPPYAALTYTWANRLPVGTVLPSPVLERSVHVVLRSGASDAGRWVWEERNVEEDFRTVFGFAAPPVSHVAVMSDADDTGGHACAELADLAFAAASEK